LNTSQVLAHIAEESGASLRELEYVVASSGIDRSDESYRKKLFVLKGGEPLCVAKWEGSVSHRLRREHDLQSTLFRKSLPVVNALKLLTLDDSLLMIEEYIDVPHVEALVERRELNTAQAVRIAHDLFVAILKGTREDSTREAFIAEFEERYSAPEITAVLKKSQRDALAHAKSTLTQHYPAHRTFSHALYHQDYRLANILFNGSRARLFDFEFSCNSHFWFLDWFRLFLYSEGLTPSAIWPL